MYAAELDGGWGAALVAFLSMKVPQTMRAYVELERELQASGRLSALELRESEMFCEGIARASSEEIATYDRFLAHMPDASEELALQVLKAHLLLEACVREFVAHRLTNPQALPRLTAHAVICLAESLCLPGDRPRWMFEMLRTINNIRNALAHQLEPPDIPAKVAEFVRLYAERFPVAASFPDCVGHMYAQLAELAREARDSRTSSA